MRFSRHPSESEVDTLEEVHDCLRLLVVGRGAQEHALCWKLASSPSVQETWVWPGNPGILRLARRAPINSRDADDYKRLADWAKDQRIDAVVITDPQLLLHGVSDEFYRRGVNCLAPDSSAFRLESSKTWAKMLLEEAGIPTARGEFFADTRHAKRFTNRLEGPWVVKADGITEGIGTTICATPEAAYEAIEANLKQHRHGVASRHIVVEEYLTGPEIQVQAITDGRSLVLLPVSRRYDRLLDGDRGSCTAGMGAIAPLNSVTPDMVMAIQNDFFIPLLRRMDERGVSYPGVIHLSVRQTSNGLKVAGINGRFADPDLQAILPLFEGDLGRVVVGAASRSVRGRVFSAKRGRRAVAVSMVIDGYPASVTRSSPMIMGLGERDHIGPDRFVFHAGTSLVGGRLVAEGPRVLTTVGVGDNYASAIERSYALADSIGYDGCYFRRDVGEQALTVNMTETKS